MVQGVVSVAATALARPDGTPSSFLVDGVVLRRGETFDSFRYRFDAPPSGRARPTTCRSSSSATCARAAITSCCASSSSAPTATSARSATSRCRWCAPAADPLGGVVAAGDLPSIPAAPGDAGAEPVVKLLAPPEGLTTGLLRLVAEVQGDEVSRLRFELDGHAVLSKARPPYSVELDLGRAPRLHRVRAVALDAAGEELASDEIAINAGPHRFAVRLVEPRPSPQPGSVVRAHAVVEVPAGESLDRVELYLDETRLATLYQPPFIQPLTVPEGRDISYVRAVAYLVEGGTAEDLVFLRAPEGLQKLDVQMVELYATVVDRHGRPVPGLGAGAFRVEEDGRPQQLARFQYLEDTPLHAGVLIDTSASMTEELDDAEKAALGFFQKLLTPRDRACVITFADEPHVVVPFSSDLEVLAGGLAHLTADGETALYDSLIYALYEFNGLQGKRVLVLISDGEDVSSRYRFDDVLDFARRAGVAIYTIGLRLPTSADRARLALSRLASETGGRSFFIQHAAELDGIYHDIERELRAQYLLIYQSDGTGDDETFRSVEVKMVDPEMTARTLRGYYP